MTIMARILALLKTCPEGIDDDELAKVLQLSARQQANSRCRALEKKGVIRRRRVNGKIRNFAVDGIALPHVGTPEESGLENSRPWFWEGNVQEVIVNYLTTQRYAIQSTADTATRQRGVDIVAEREGQRLWVSVKGYPVGTARTSPSLQASHWFKQVVFDVLAYRGSDKDVAIGVGLPDYRRYRDMSQKIDWFKPIGKFSYFWVRADGGVLVE